MCAQGKQEEGGLENVGLEGGKVGVAEGRAGSVTEESVVPVQSRV